MDAKQLKSFVNGHRISFTESKSSNREYAQHLDSTDPLARFRAEFLIPSKADLRDPHPEAKPAAEQNGIPPRLTLSLPYLSTSITHIAVFQDLSMID